MPFAKAFFEYLQSIRPESRLRLAPTPSGYLHIGNALNFVLIWVAARSRPGARILLRIDDLDAERARPEFVRDIFETLEWLGLDWDEGPKSEQDLKSTWSQHHRMQQYQELLDQLRLDGHLFACQKSRKELRPYSGRYPEQFIDQGLSLDATDVAWRIRTPRPLKTNMSECFVVRRRDGIPAYQIASLADDFHYKITHVIRGADLFESTIAQRYIAECLRLDRFSAIQFLHHPLVNAPEGNKLSKSAGADALMQWRKEGRSPESVFSLVAHWLEIPDKPVRSANQLLGIVKKYRITE